MQRAVAWGAEMRRVHEALREEAMRAGAGAEVMHRHLDGISAIMESHFGYEERQLLSVLDRLGADDALDAAPQEAFGPLA